MYSLLNEALKNIILNVLQTPKQSNDLIHFMQSLNNKKVSKKQVRWVAKVLQIALGSSMFSMSLGAKITNQITLQKWSKRKVLSTLVVLVTTGHKME